MPPGPAPAMPARGERPAPRHQPIPHPKRGFGAESRKDRRPRRPEVRAMLPIHTVLHPTDFSDRSERALSLACALTRDYGARLVVLHVAPLPAMAYAEGVVAPDP